MLIFKGDITVGNVAKNNEQGSLLVKQVGISYVSPALFAAFEIVEKVDERNIS
jgi:hypothetical protein